MIDYKARALKAVETRKKKKEAGGGSDVTRPVDSDQTLVQGTSSGAVRNDTAKPKPPASSPKPPRPDKFGRAWPHLKDSELCLTCGQPGEECDHKKLSAKDAAVFKLPDPRGDEASRDVKPKAPEKKADKPCLCGCGTRVKGKFLQGHDAKLHGIVRQAFNKKEKLPKNLIALAGAYVKGRWPHEAKDVL